MGLKKGDQLDVEVIGTAFGAKGIAKIDGLTVFVENAIPGDIASIFITKKKKDYALAAAVSIKKSSEHRIEPPCKYSGMCGGCKWQFLDYNMQLEYKREHVYDALKHIGKIDNPVVSPVKASEQIFGYRNKMEFSISDKKWLPKQDLGNKEIDKDFAIGLHVPGTFYKVLDIEKCLLQQDTGNLILNTIRKYIINSDKTLYNLKTHTGFWRFVVIRRSEAYGEWMVNIVTSEKDLASVQNLADILTDKYPNIASVVNNINARKSSTAEGEYEITLSGKPYIKEKIFDIEFTISASSFFQPNPLSAQKLYQTVKDFAQLSGTQKVLDLYSGTGSISLIIADKASSVLGLEISEQAVKDAEKNCINNRISNCRFIAGDIKKSIKEIDIEPDVVIADPPRAGIQKEALKCIMEKEPEKIVCVSCNPSTLARDLFVLKEKYKITDVLPIDMFPHTPHIETVAQLVKDQHIYYSLGSA